MLSESFEGLTFDFFVIFFNELTLVHFLVKNGSGEPRVWFTSRLGEARSAAKESTSDDFPQSRGGRCERTAAEAGPAEGGEASLSVLMHRI